MVSVRTTHRFRVSLFQTMKLMVFPAAALAFVSTVLRGTGSGPLSVMLFSGVAVPLVWAALCFMLVRRGPWRDRAILLLLLVSVSVTLGNCRRKLVSQFLALCLLMCGHPVAGMEYT